MRQLAFCLPVCLLTATIASAQSGPAHRWTFDESSGSTAVDSGSGPTVNGTLGSGATRIPGVVGSGAVNFAPFDLDGYVDMDTSVAAFGTGDFTISFWVKKSPGPRFGELVGTRGGFGSGGNFVDFRGSDARITLEIMEDGGGTGYIPIGADVPLADGNWHHITGVRSGPTAWLYFDDVLVVTGDSVDGVTANLQQVFPFTVGVNDVERTFRDLNCGCSFDDVRIYNRALSPYEIMKPADAITALTGLINGLGLPRGLTNSLTAKLGAAAAALKRGDSQTAINILGAFQNEVAAQAGKGLTSDQAAQLTAIANLIIGNLQG